jgi:hypothetical protein
MIRLLRRSAAAPTTSTAPATLSPVLRFITVGGAEVHVTQHQPDPREGHDRVYRVFRWWCTGCDEGTFRYPRNDLLRADHARMQANGHAASCRALPGGVLDPFAAHADSPAQPWSPALAPLAPRTRTASDTPAPRTPWSGAPPYPREGRP